MSVKITQWTFKRKNIEPPQADVSEHYQQQKRNLDGLSKIIPRMCVFHTRCHREGNTFLYLSATFHFHTLCASVPAVSTHDKPHKGKQRRLRRLRSPSCVGSTLPTVHKQTVSYLSVICTERMSSGASVKSSKRWQRWDSEHQAGQGPLGKIVAYCEKWREVQFRFCENTYFAVTWNLKTFIGGIRCRSWH